MLDSLAEEGIIRRRCEIIKTTFQFRKNTKRQHQMNSVRLEKWRAPVNASFPRWFGQVLVASELLKVL